MIALCPHGGKTVSTISVLSAKLLHPRLLTISRCAQTMSDKASPPLGALRLHPLNVRAAFDDTGMKKSDAALSKVVGDVQGDRDKAHLQTVATLSAGNEGPVESVDMKKDLIATSSVTGTPARKLHQVQKETVLPQTLLKEVTAMVKRQDVTLPGAGSDQPEKSSVIDKNLNEFLTDKPDCSKMDNSGKSDKSSASEFGMFEPDEGNLIHNTNTQKQGDKAKDHNLTLGGTLSESSIEKIADCHSPESNSESVDIQTCSTNKGALSDKHDFIVDPFGELDLDLVEEKKQIAVDETDVLPDLAALFSGELERRRKKELKKAKQKGWKKTKMNKKKVESHTEKEENDVKKPAKPTVNYFVGIQISDPQIQAALKKVQDSVVSVCKELTPALNKPATLHMTLFVLGINNEEDMLRSKQALDEAQKRLQPLYKESPLYLDIVGLGHFRHEVVFAKIKSADQVSQLQHIAETVEDCFLDQEVISPDKKGFKPHITIMKLSFLRGRKGKGVKKIDEKLYQDYSDTEFGSQKVDTLQLCSIHKKKDESGYYQIDHKVCFAASVHNNENPDDLSLDGIDKPLADNTRESEETGMMNVDTEAVTQQFVNIADLSKGASDKEIGVDHCQELHFVTDSKSIDTDIEITDAICSGEKGEISKAANSGNIGDKTSDGTFVTDSMNRSESNYYTVPDEGELSLTEGLSDNGDSNRIANDAAVNSDAEKVKQDG